MFAVIELAVIVVLVLVVRDQEKKIAQLRSALIDKAVRTLEGR
jgi:hypothetical protein